VIPHYSYWSSNPSTKEQREIYRNYVAHPFLHRRGNGFKLPKDKEAGIVWFPGCKFTGEEISLEGLFFIAPGYQPHWLGGSLAEGLESDLQLSPISGENSSQMIEDLLSQIERGVIRMTIPCTLYMPGSSPCILGVRFNKKEHDVVRSFLQRAIK
jgi:hypothetical protein